jgi:isopentenyl diphosphate isomerase/L-lactate dehydrogenase-like FMN-dependent dehydrogenase
MIDPPAFITVDDYEPVARGRLPKDVYAFYAGGAGDEWTLAENRRAFDRWTLRPRFLRGAGEPDPSTTLLGTPASFPVLVAPWAYQRMAHPDGELATARAAAAAGTIMVVSSTTVNYLEDVASASSGPKWWQLYVFEDRDATTQMLRRVADAGFQAICLTIDVPQFGLRHRDTRSGFEIPITVNPSSLMYAGNLSWDDLGWIRDASSELPLLLKGILTAEDALLAVEAEVDGIVVSNHGGRQLDGSPAGISVLPEVVGAVKGRIPVLMDGGIRRGTDVLKALALGASAVMVGRPAVWGLAVDGEAGVADVLRILREEFENAMALTGCRTVAEIGGALVAPASPA